MAFGLVLLWASWGLIRDALHILLQGTPQDLDIRGAIDALHQLPGVTDVHHVHAWSLTSGMNIFLSHVCVREGHESQRVLEEATRLLRDRFNAYFSTIQVEERCLASEEAATRIDIAGQLAEHDQNGGDHSGHQ